LPIAAALLVLGAAAVGHWLYWLLQPATGWDVTDGATGAAVFLFAPTALAGAALVVGGGLMFRAVAAGRVVATVGLGLSVLFALYWGIAVLASLGECGALARGCGREWGHIGWSALALAVALYCLVAVRTAARPFRT
jgi:hypothetical protein